LVISRSWVFSTHQGGGVAGEGGQWNRLARSFATYGSGIPPLKHVTGSSPEFNGGAEGRILNGSGSESQSENTNFIKQPGQTSRKTLDEISTCVGYGEKTERWFVDCLWGGEEGGPSDQVPS